MTKVYKPRGRARTREYKNQHKPYFVFSAQLQTISILYTFIIIIIFNVFISNNKKITSHDDYDEMMILKKALQ
jgi:hypothetical protein